MSIGTAMEAAVRAHVGELQPALVTDGEVTITTYEEARDVLGSNAEIAEQAGYGAPGQYRKGSPEWTRRRTFMRGLQRSEQRRTGGSGQSRSGAKLVPRIVTVARIEATRQNTPQTVRDVIRLMGMRGTTTSFVKINFAYSPRWREVEAIVYTARSVYQDVGWNMRGYLPATPEEWDRLGERYVEAWCIAYGIPGEVFGGTGGDSGVAGDPIFLFTIGRDEERDIDYEYT